MGSSVSPFSVLLFLCLFFLYLEYVALYQISDGVLPFFQPVEAEHKKERLEVAASRG